MRKNHFSRNTKWICKIETLVTICINVLLSKVGKSFCDHLLGNGRPLGSLVCDVLCVFVTFPYRVLSQLWFLIESISDLIFVFSLTLKIFQIPALFFPLKPDYLTNYLIQNCRIVVDVIVAHCPKVKKECRSMYFTKTFKIHREHV